MGAVADDGAITTELSLISAIQAIAEAEHRIDALRAVGDTGAKVLGCTGALVLRPLSEGKLKLAHASDADVGAAALEVEDRNSRGIFRLILDGDAPVLSNDLLADPRFRRYSSALVARTAIKSLLGVPLRVAGEDLGALVVYSNQPHFFHQAVCIQARSFGMLAAVALSRVIHHEQNRNALAALDTNREVGVALGILMSTQHLTHEAAFDKMKTASQTQHRKLRDIAADVTFTGQLAPTSADHDDSRATVLTPTNGTTRS
jgi:GAF domain-containing protein